MKSYHPFILALFLLVMLFAFTPHDDPGSIRGRIIPYNAALHAWAVSDMDTAAGAIVSGSFEIKQLQPGKYRVIIEGLRPYKVTTKTDVLVISGVSTDVGDIILDQ
jgi:hypothetical protein